MRGLDHMVLPYSNPAVNVYSSNRLGSAFLVAAAIGGKERVSSGALGVGRRDRTDGVWWQWRKGSRLWKILEDSLVTMT